MGFVPFSKKVRRKFNTFHVCSNFHLYLMPPPPLFAAMSLMRALWATTTSAWLTCIAGRSQPMPPAAPRALQVGEDLILIFKMGSSQ